MLLKRYQGVSQSLYTIHSTYGGNNDDFLASGSEGVCDICMNVYFYREGLPIAWLAMFVLLCFVVHVQARYTVVCLPVSVCSLVYSKIYCLTVAMQFLLSTSRERKS